MFIRCVVTVPASMSSNRTQGVGLRNPEQEERNRRAFEGWLMRKQEERKCQLAAKQQALKAADAERVEAQKKLMANRAYQQWLTNKNLDQQQKRKEEKIEKELKALHDEQRKAEQKRSEESFLSWKRRKDLERAVQHHATSGLQPIEDDVGPTQTPTLPGYCSVWSCDEELADYMLGNVYRLRPAQLDTQ